MCRERREKTTEDGRDNGWAEDRTLKNKASRVNDEAAMDKGVVICTVTTPERAILEKRKKKRLNQEERDDLQSKCLL